MNLKQALKGKLSEKELALLNKSFDTVGQIAILEIPKKLEKKQKLIAETLLKLHSHIKTVVKKLSPRKGKFRIQKIKFITGEKNITANYKESGCCFKISLGKVYFSPRLSTERLRIARQVKEGERVGVFFAGVGPYCVVIAKHSKVEKIFGFEWNPKAVKDFKENIKLNKMQEKIEFIQGNVKKTGKKFKNVFDRIVMPSPSNSWSYLNTGFECCKKKAILHFYCFSSVENPFKKPVEKIMKIAEKARVKVKVLSKKIVRPYSKTKCQIVLDLKVNK